MALKYKKLISDYCTANGIIVPPGFGRNTPGHLAVIRTDRTSDKLVATTWSKITDVLYYVENQLILELGEAVTAIRVVNFKTGEIFEYTSPKQMKQIGTIQFS